MIQKDKEKDEKRLNVIVVMSNFLLLNVPVGKHQDTDFSFS